MQGDTSVERSELATEIITSQSQAAGVQKGNKNPKRVAAGKALVASNKRARDALKREIEATRGGNANRGPHATRGVNNDDRRGSLAAVGGAWIPSLDLPTIISIVGIGLAIFQIFRDVKAGRAAEQTPAQQEKRGSLAASHTIDHTHPASKSTPLGMD